MLAMAASRCPDPIASADGSLNSAGAAEPGAGVGVEGAFEVADEAGAGAAGAAGVCADAGAGVDGAAFDDEAACTALGCSISQMRIVRGSFEAK